jgi:hypothetical protein
MAMDREHVVLTVREISERMLKARLQAGSATTTERRQHAEGMANYWQELLTAAEDDQRAGAPLAQGCAA